MISVFLLLLAQVDSPTATLSPAALAAPAKGGIAFDPVFGIAVKRLTDHGERGGMATAEYPQLQAFDSTETKILLTRENGARDIVDLEGNVLYAGLSLVFPRWLPRVRNTLIAFNRSSGGTIWLQEARLNPGGTITRRNLINVSALGYSTLDAGCWEDLSANGRYLTLLDRANTKVSVLDIHQKKLRATVQLHADVDWVRVSASGRYLAVQYVARGLGPNQGLVIYGASSGRYLGHVADHPHHGDLGRDESGFDVFTTIGYTSSCAGGTVGCLSTAILPNALELGARNDLLQMPAEVGSYTSCRNEQNAGFCLHADDYGRTTGARPFERELWLTRLHDGAVRRLFHHRSSSCGYFNLTRPVLSPSGRYALFTSDWARPNCDGEADTYLIDLRPMLSGWAPGEANFPGEMSP